MSSNAKTLFQMTDVELADTKSTFAFDVFSHVINVLEHRHDKDRFCSEDLSEDFFWMRHSKYPYQAGKFMETIDALVKLDLFYLAKYATDLTGHSLYQRECIKC